MKFLTETWSGNIIFLKNYQKIKSENDDFLDFFQDC